jgi:serine/threonine-protein kinase RsbW
MTETARVVLTMPADASFVRLARLAAADAGSRAGFTLEEIDDLRIAVGELCVQVMGPGATTSLTFAISPGRIEIDGVGPPAPDSDVTEIADSIVSAVADGYEVSTNGATRQFHLTKQSVPARA